MTVNSNEWLNKLQISFIIMFRLCFWPNNALTVSGNQITQCVLFCVCVSLVTLETIIFISEAMGSCEGGKATGFFARTPPNPTLMLSDI